MQNMYNIWGLLLGIANLQIGSNYQVCIYIFERDESPEADRSGVKMSISGI